VGTALSRAASSPRQRHAPEVLVPDGDQLGCLRDGLYLISWHSIWEPAGENAARVEAVDVVHRDPELPVVLAPVVDADDVRVPQC